MQTADVINLITDDESSCDADRPKKTEDVALTSAGRRRVQGVMEPPDVPSPSRVAPDPSAPGHPPPLSYTAQLTAAIRLVLQDEGHLLTATQHGLMHAFLHHLSSGAQVLLYRLLNRQRTWIRAQRMRPVRHYTGPRAGEDQVAPEEADLVSAMEGPQQDEEALVLDTHTLVQELAHHGFVEMQGPGTVAGVLGLLTKPELLVLAKARAAHPHPQRLGVQELRAKLAHHARSQATLSWARGPESTAPGAPGPGERLLLDACARLHGPLLQVTQECVDTFHHIAIISGRLRTWPSEGDAGFWTPSILANLQQAPAPPPRAEEEPPSAGSRANGRTVYVRLPPEVYCRAGQPQVWPMRDAFVSYVEALKLEHALQGLRDLNTPEGYNQLVDMCEPVFWEWHALVTAPSDAASPQALISSSQLPAAAPAACPSLDSATDAPWKEAAPRPRPPWYTLFTRVCVLTRCMHTFHHALHRLQSWPALCTVLEALITQDVCLHRKRGTWYDVLTKTLVKRGHRGSAMQWCARALQDVHVPRSTGMGVYKRLCRLLAARGKEEQEAGGGAKARGKRKRTPTPGSSSSSDEEEEEEEEEEKGRDECKDVVLVPTVTRLPEIPGHWASTYAPHPVPQRHVPLPKVRSAPGSKAWYLSPHAADPVGVEEACLHHYTHHLGWEHGYHAEGSLLTTLWALVMWECVWDSRVPGVFGAPYQAAPLDWGTEYFGVQREAWVRERLGPLLHDRRPSSLPPLLHPLHLREEKQVDVVPAGGSDGSNDDACGDGMSWVVEQIRRVYATHGPPYNTMCVGLRWEYACEELVSLAEVCVCVDACLSIIARGTCRCALPPPPPRPLQLTHACLPYIHPLAHAKQCLGTRALASICTLLTQDYRGTAGGLPDLCLWSPSGGGDAVDVGKHQGNRVLLVEVKGPGDRLSGTQQVWLERLQGFGVAVEVCHVRDGGH